MQDTTYLFRQPRPKGFTIVELLIVIVVIGILAAIVIVAYNGVTVRANNASIIASASQAIKSVQASMITNGGDYPGTSHSCLTATSGCSGGYTVRPTINDAITAVASLPGSVPKFDSSNYGIIYNYAASRTFNGVGNIQPLIIMYYLQGAGVDCGLPNVTNSGGTTMKTSTTGYTAGASGPTTTCAISIAGP